MTVFIEISNPPQWKPWRYSSPLMHRFGWAWFACGILRVSFRQFCEAPKVWESLNEKYPTNHR